MKYNSNPMYTYIIYIITYQSDKSYGSHRPLYLSFHMYLATMNRGPAEGRRSGSRARIHRISAKTKFEDLSSRLIGFTQLTSPKILRFTIRDISAYTFLEARKRLYTQDGTFLNNVILDLQIPGTENDPNESGYQAIRGREQIKFPRMGRLFWMKKKTQNCFLTKKTSGFIDNTYA